MFFSFVFTAPSFLKRKNFVKTSETYFYSNHLFAFSLFSSNNLFICILICCGRKSGWHEFNSINLNKFKFGTRALFVWFRFLFFFLVKKLVCPKCFSSFILTALQSLNQTRFRKIIKRQWLTFVTEPLRS